MHQLTGASPAPVYSRSVRQRGAVAVYTALLLVLLIGFAGLMLDTARVKLTAQELQRAADSAAMAGVPFLDDPDVSAPLDYTFARDRACAAALANNAANAPVVLVRNEANVSTGDVVVGTWDSSSETFTPFDVSGSPPSGQPATPTAVKVTARKTVGHPNGPLPLMFGPAFGAAHSEVARSAIATRAPPKDPLIFILDPNGARAMAVGGNANVLVQQGVVQINSSNPNALFFTGSSATISASRIQVVGGSNQVVPNLVTGAPVVPDPFASVAFPLPPYTAMSPAQITGPGTYPAGYYPGGIKANSGPIVLSMGTFIFGTPGIDLTGNAVVRTDPDVTICLLKAQPTWSPTKHATIRIQGTCSLQVAAPPGAGGGTYAGLAVYMQPGNTGSISVGGTGGLDITGFIYGPSGTLDLGGTTFYSIGGIDMWNMVTQGSGDVTGINVPPGSGPPSVFLVE